MPPKVVGKKRIRIIKQISKNQIENLRRSSYSKSKDTGFLFDFIYYGALRRSEVGKLKVNSFNWEEWFLNIEMPIELNIQLAKGNKDRIVLIPSKTIKNFLEIYIQNSKIKINDPEQLKTMLSQNNNPIFTNIHGENLTGGNIWHKIKKISENALNIQIRPHELRHCVSEDTEILTLDGWKKYNELQENEVIFNYDINSNSIKKDKIKKIYIYDFDGKLIHLKNSYLDFLITENHKIIVKEINSKKETIGWEIKPFDKVNLKSWNLHHKISAQIYQRDNLLGIEKAGILGWILSDGSINKRNHPSISISQSIFANKKKVDYIENLLKKGNIPYTKKEQYIKCGLRKEKSLFATFHILKGGNGSKNPKKMGKNHEWIFQFITSDRKPKKELYNLSLVELTELYACMMMGDGTLPKKYKKNREFTGQGKERNDFFRILCLLLGHITTQSWKIQNGKKYSRIYVCEGKNYTKLLKTHISKEKYKGIIWCPKTENGTFICKRNEKIAITGNSRATELEKKGHNIRTIQHYLGHSNPQITETYLHTTEKHSLNEIKNKM